MTISSPLIKKYNVPGPRYTSYPTVPYWDQDTFSLESWKEHVRQGYIDSAKDGLSLYVHLPFCESLCTYCGCNTRITVNHFVEGPYIRTVLDEWKLYKAILQSDAIGIRDIHLGGGTPTFFSPQNLSVLVSGLLDGTTDREHTGFSFEGHPANTSAEHLKTLYRLGFRRLSLGIQDFDPVVQETINRKQSYHQVKEVTERARSIGYTSINYDLIYGLPKQNIKGLTETIQKILLLQPDRIAFYSYAHVPWIKPGQRTFTEEDLPKDEEKLELYQIGRAMLEAVGYKEIGMDHFALQTDSLYQAYSDKTLHRNFMGYTESPSKMLIGLGCSSISDTWTAFAQNLKTVEAYTAAVESGDLPVFKGHMLSEQDLVIRQHILNLMCRMETSWVASEMFDQAIEDGVFHLAEMEKDGLVTITDKKVSITARGRSFMRNCCYAFDARMQSKNPERQIFSNSI